MDTSQKAARVGGLHQASHDTEGLGLKSLTAFHDLTNAFGSVEWEAMDRAAAALLGPNHLLGQQRYRLATTTIPGKDGDVTLKIGEGGLMGDPLDGGSILGGIPRVDDSLAACCGRRGSGVGSTFHYRSMPMTQPDGCAGEVGEVLNDIFDGALVLAEQGEGGAPHAFSGRGLICRSSFGA